MNKLISCQKFNEQLNAYLDNELDQKLRCAMDEHAKSCPECGEQLEAMTGILTMCAELDEGVQMPFEGQAAWRRAIRIEAASAKKKAGAPVFLRGLSSVAAALVLLVGATMVYRNMPNLSPATIETNTMGSIEQSRGVDVMPLTASGDAHPKAGPVLISDGAADDVLVATQPESFDAVEAPEDKAVIGLPAPVDGFDPSVAEGDRKVIRSASRDIESTNFDQDIQKIRDLADEYGGQIPERNISGEKLQAGMTEGRYAWMNVRVPTSELDDFLIAIQAVGTATQSGDYQQDITGGYYDVQSRLTTEREFLVQLQAMIPDTTNLQEVLELQSKINEAQANIESLTSAQKDYDKQLDYSSVSISVREVADRNAVKPIDSGSLSGRVKTSFYDSINLFVQFAQDALVVLVLVWPWIVIGVVLLIIICAASRKRRNR